MGAEVIVALAEMLRTRVGAGPGEGDGEGCLECEVGAAWCVAIEG